MNSFDCQPPLVRNKHKFHAQKFFTDETTTKRSSVTLLNSSNSASAQHSATSNKLPYSFQNVSDPKFQKSDEMLRSSTIPIQPKPKNSSNSTLSQQPITSNKRSFDFQKIGVNPKTKKADEMSSSSTSQLQNRLKNSSNSTSLQQSTINKKRSCDFQNINTGPFTVRHLSSKIKDSSNSTSLQQFNTSKKRSYNSQSIGVKAKVQRSDELLRRSSVQFQSRIKNSSNPNFTSLQRSSTSNKRSYDSDADCIHSKNQQNNLKRLRNSKISSFCKGSTIVKKSPLSQNQKSIQTSSQKKHVISNSSEKLSESSLQNYKSKFQLKCPKASNPLVTYKQKTNIKSKKWNESQTFEQQLEIMKKMLFNFQYSV
ncbi:13997_t:CDS:2 [Funneliformis mosseae]|uniref:13997_t:CDS:1 n=1 Tax=Funneliformis mosseae TaxID=27381 RepID=A0A9N8Z654_FUNMO|nr:13997_t:CDS:2 [Funneliformis mosseae]